MSARTSIPASATAQLVRRGGVVDVLTGSTSAVPPVPGGLLGADDARALTARIRQAARDVAERVERLLQLVDQAIGGEAWRVLGYASAAAYIVDVVEPMHLRVEQRRVVVGWLTGRGMSTRAIAPLVSVDQKTVLNDRRAIAAAALPAGEEDSSPAATIIGLDGRTYGATSERPTLSVVPAAAVTPVHDVIGLPEAQVASRFIVLLAARLADAGVITATDWTIALTAAQEVTSTVGRARSAVG